MLSAVGVLGGLALVPAAASKAIAASPRRTSVDSDARPSVSPAEFQAEYSDATVLFPNELPFGYSFPGDVPASSELPMPDRFRGDGEALAYVWWLVAAEHASVAAFDRGDVDAQAYWLNVASQFPLTEPRVLNVIDPSHEWESAVLLPALEAADLEPMRTHINQSSVAPFLPAQASS